MTTIVQLYNCSHFLAYCARMWDTHRIPRHQNIAAWSKDTKFIRLTEHAPAKALAVPVSRIHLLTTILRGTLILPRVMPHSPMGGVWWAAETPRPLSYLDLPETLDTQSLRCLRMCMREPSDVAPAIDTADVAGERKTRVRRHRLWLREAATWPGYVSRRKQPARRGGSARHGPVACRGLRTSLLGQRR